MTTDLKQRIRTGKLTEAQLARLRWLKTARRPQVVPTDLVRRGYNGWCALPGRAWGKTRAGAEHTWWHGYRNPGCRIAIVAPTFATARDLCVEGESGIQSIMPRSLEKQWNRSTGELWLANGTIVQLFSGDKPERLRGYQSHMTWFEELAAFQYPQEAFDMALLGLRLGETPHFIATSTPKPIPIIKDLVKRDDVLLVEGHTRENAGNLPGVFLRQIVERYGGTRLGLQEIEGRILEDTPGALWKQATIEEHRLKALRADAREAFLGSLVKVVVGVDPYGGAANGECGIVVAGNDAQGHTYILEDCSGAMGPLQWGNRIARAYEEWQADLVVAESNYGGDMVRVNIQTVAPEVPVKMVTATRGKAVRAEPIASRYEQGKVHHVGSFPDLESQMTTWVPGDRSPDRMDALVWAATELGTGSGFEMD